VTQTWTDRELAPYKSLISEGYADAVMSAHIVNKKLDPKGLPGTLSNDILSGILRKQLGFDGLVFSDDMQMHAITRHYGLEEAIRLAINAGIDIMTFSNNIVGSEERTVDKVHSIIKRLVASGAISEERINQSYRRIMAAKKRLVTEWQEGELETALTEKEHRITELESKLAEVTAEKEKLVAQLATSESEADKDNKTKKKAKKKKKR